MTEQTRKAFWKALEASPFLMVGLEARRAHAVPMTAQLDKHADSAFWFYTSRDNRLAAGGGASAQFASKAHDIFASIFGTLVEETDPEVIDRYWSNEVAAWFEGGRHDPKLMMLRFELGEAEVWTADLGVKGLFKLFTGQTIAADEAGRHETISL